MEEPKRAWPPTVSSKDFVIGDGYILKEEEYKAKLDSNKFLIPSPELAGEYNSSRLTQFLKEKVMYLADKIVTMSAFNVVSSVKDY